MPPKKDIPQGLKDWLAKPENIKKRQEAIAKNKAVKTKKVEAKKEVETKPTIYVVNKPEKPKPIKVIKSTKEEKLLALKLSADKAKIHLPDELFNLVKDFVPSENFKFTNNNDAIKEPIKEIRSIIKTISKIPIAKVRTAGVEFIEKPENIGTGASNKQFRQIETFRYDFDERNYTRILMPEMKKQYPALNEKILMYFVRYDYDIKINIIGIYNKKTNELYLEITFPPAELINRKFVITTPNYTQLDNNEGWPVDIVVLSNIKGPPRSNEITPLEDFFNNKLRFKNRNEILKFILQ